MEGFVEPRGRNRKIPAKFSIRGAKVERVGSSDSRGTFQRMEREREEEKKNKRVEKLDRRCYRSNFPRNVSRR